MATAILTYKYRIKDKRCRKALRAHAYAVNQVWNWCVAQHRDTLDRYRAGAPARRWATGFDLVNVCAGVGAALGIRQQSAGLVCLQWARRRSLTFRASFGAGRALGWVPFNRQGCRIASDSITHNGRTYRVFGANRRPIPASIVGGAFVEDALGRWWACFSIEVERASSAASGEIGVDLGLKDFAAFSTGDPPVTQPRAYRVIEGRLAVAQRSGNRRLVIALHAKATNVRRDFHHKLSRRLANEYALIVCGNVNAKLLAKTRMAKSVLDAGWSSFRDMLRYKAARYVEVDERFTTQTCSACGEIPASSPKGMGALGVRSWECSSCGASHDRDVNAAKNILRIGRSTPPPVEEGRAKALSGAAGRRLLSVGGKACS